MTIASLLRKIMYGFGAPQIFAQRGVFLYLINNILSTPKDERLFLNPLIQISHLSSNFAYKHFEAFAWELKKGFPIPVSASCPDLAHPPVLGHSSNGCAVRHNSAAWMNSTKSMNCTGGSR
jgi:hypothetical protein